jgi:hypothetical protein
LLISVSNGWAYFTPGRVRDKMDGGANHGGGDQGGCGMSGVSEWPADRRITIVDLQAATDRGEREVVLTTSPRRPGEILLAPAEPRSQMRIAQSGAGR